MKTKLISLFIIALAVPSCGPQPAMDVDRSRVSYDLSDTTSVIDVYPQDRQMDVPIDALIRLKFSSPININSVDQFSFRVEDQNKTPVDGYIDFSPAGDEIYFKRRIRDFEGGLDASKKYRVISRYIRDQSDHLIGPFSVEFATNAKVPNTGKFRALKVEPDEFLWNEKTDFIVEFSESIQAPNGNRCSTDEWADAFQIKQIDFFTKDGSINAPAFDGEICLICDSRNVCDRLLVSPTNYWSAGTFIAIEVKPTAGLKGVSGQGLSNELREEKLVLNVGLY